MSEITGIRDLTLARLARLLELAMLEVHRQHLRWRTSKLLPNTGHAGEFLTCPHPDCELVRSVETPQEATE